MNCFKCTNQNQQKALSNAEMRRLEYLLRRCEFSPQASSRMPIMFKPGKTYLVCKSSIVRRGGYHMGSSKMAQSLKRGNPSCLPSIHNIKTVTKGIRALLHFQRSFK